MKNHARLYIDTNRIISDIPPLLFGGFAEHLGRCIYEGIYDPSSPLADQNGFRTDVISALKELNFSIIRYPGGNFLSGYHWMDGVGDRKQRPRRRELAWQSIETNQFGVNEFIQFCREINTLPMLGTNLGTGSIEEAASLVEYCNAPAGSYLADLRISHGFRQPHDVKYWCLGNEMDGIWQIGHLEALDYGIKAREAAKLMKWQDPSIKLILCGSSSMSMSTFPEWDRNVLEACWEYVDYLSLHCYVGNRENNTPRYLAISSQLEQQVDILAAALRYVKAKLRSKRDIYLSWDEWNVWYKAQNWQGGWTPAPHLIEEEYNLEDALVVAQWMNVFLRKCDILKIACLAQIVNVIAPILTNPTGLVKQTTFYPFNLFRKFTNGKSLDVLVKSPVYHADQVGEVPLLDVSSCYDPDSGTSTIYIVHRGLSENLPLEIIWQDLAPKTVIDIYQLAGMDPKAANTFERPETVVPIRLPGFEIKDKTTTLIVPPLSFTTLVCKFDVTN